MPRINASGSAKKLAKANKGIPHSPFQKLIDTRRKAKGHTFRSLAQAIGSSHASLYIWLTNANGFPSPKAFKAHHLKALSVALHIPMRDLQVALDASRRLYTPCESPLPPAQVDAFRELITIFENDKRRYILKETVLNLLRRFYAGAERANPHAPHP